MPPQPLAKHSAGRLVAAVFALGLLLSLGMLVRSQVAGDQLNLLARGWLLAAKGTFIAYGNPMSTGGKAPGGITSLLVGLPLAVWRDHRAPSVLILLFHAAAFLLLDTTLKRALRPHERLLFAVVYWLNPWRLYLSAFLWNPNYLFLFGALHLWTCLRQREAPSFWLSFLHAAGLALAFQVHASFLLLAVASALLWWRRFFRVHWAGAVTGAVLAALPLIPWYLEVRAHPAIVTEASKGFPGRGLLLVFPLLRGVMYWLRYGSLYPADNVTAFDFTDLLGSDHRIGWALMTAARVLLPLTLLAPVLANRRLWRPVRRRFRAWRAARALGHGGHGTLATVADLVRFGLSRDMIPAPALSERVWLRGYVLWSFVGAVLVFCLAPTTVMYWQVIILFHAAVLPVALWGGALWRRAGSREWAGRAVAAWTAVSVGLAVAIGLGAPMFRCHGRKFVTFPLAHHSAMFEELGIQATCPWPLDQPGGWWPDVLPPE